MAGKSMAMREMTTYAHGQPLPDSGGGGGGDGGMSQPAALPKAEARTETGDIMVAKMMDVIKGTVDEKNPKASKGSGAKKSPEAKNADVSWTAPGGSPTSLKVRKLGPYTL